MTKRKLYTVKFGGIGNKWATFDVAQGKDLQFCQGFCRGIQQYTPSPRMQIVDHHTGELAEDFKGTKPEKP